MAPFRVNAKNFSLTYPQANDITKADLFEHLKSFNPKYVLLAEELHADAGRHFHAAVSFTKKLDIRDSRHFDFRGAHANTQGTRKWRDWLEYLQKEDGSPLEFGDPIQKSSWGDALKAENREDFLALVRTISPRDYILQQSRIIAFANSKYLEKVLYAPRWTNFNITTNMQRWLLQYKSPDRPQSLFVKGPTRTGKTEWARSIGRHIYWNGMIDLSSWDEEAEYAIFDDFDWSFLPQKKGFFGAQREFTLTDKYKKKQTVNWGKPCIYLYNEDMDPKLKCTAAELSWLENNAIFTEIRFKMF